MEKKEIYQTPAMEVVELKEEICLQVISGTDPNATILGAPWDN